LIDAIVPRSELKERLITYLGYVTASRNGSLSTAGLEGTFRLYGLGFGVARDTCRLRRCSTA